MIFLDYRDRDFLAHTAEVMSDRLVDGGDYEPSDEAALDKLTHLGNGATALVVSGDELTRREALELLKQVIEANIGHWVPNASQRLIWRAAAALGFEMPKPHDADCGPDASHHALIADWVCGLYIERCAVCARLFQG